MMGCLADMLVLTARPLTLTLDVAMEPADHVIHSGILSDIPVGQLQSGESRELEVPVCFAAGGVFELEAHARLWQDVSEGGKVGHGWLKVDIQ